jgi:hypothetical protein
MMRTIYPDFERLENDAYLICLITEGVKASTISTSLTVAAD